jgi:hypothetical protein
MATKKPSVDANRESEKARPAAKSKPAKKKPPEFRIITKKDFKEMTDFGERCATCKKVMGEQLSDRELKASGMRDRVFVRCSDHGPMMIPTKYVTKQKRTF